MSHVKGNFPEMPAMSFLLDAVVHGSLMLVDGIAEDAIAAQVKALLAP